MVCVLAGQGSARAWQEPSNAPSGVQVPASEAERLYQQEPFDEIFFKNEDRDRIKVQLLDLPERKMPDPAKLKATDSLKCRKLDDPTDEYSVRWLDIEKINFFEQMVLDEALVVVKAAKEDASKFDVAYDYFEHLKRYYPNTPGLNVGLGEFLYQDAGHWQKEHRYEDALALLNEAHRVNPGDPRLEQALGRATEPRAHELIEQHDDYPGARRLVRALLKKYPQSAAGKKLEDEWSAEARELLGEARALSEAGEMRKAWDVAYRAIYVWPRSSETRAFVDDLQRRFPRVIVGVRSAAGANVPNRLIDWAARRNGRLLHRLIAEFSEMGPEGGKYICPFGKFEKTDLGQRMIFRLRRNVRWNQVDEPLTGFDFARRLLWLAEEGRPDFLADWAEVFGGVEVRDVNEVHVDLRWPHVHPLALLQTSLSSPAAPSHAAGERPSETVDTTGPYVEIERRDAQVHYLANDRYFALGPTQPREVIEQYFATGEQAVAALVQNQIQALDRVFPWEAETLRARPELIVERYVLPSLHCLVPNPERALPSHRSFRRAVLLGINRDMILKHNILRDAERPGCQVVSGPFPPGVGFDDPLRYAYNVAVAQAPWDQRLAMMRAMVALHDVSAAAVKRGEPEIKQFPPLVLAYPSHELARTACQAIVKHLASVKITVALRELPPGEVIPADGNYDFLYTEVFVQEPVVDAARLLGPAGVAGSNNEYLNLALRQLETAPNWKAAGERLQRIHQIVADDATIIPLWQLTEHYAYHRALNGMGQGLVLLYQNVEQWQGKIALPAEE